MNMQRLTAGILAAGLFFGGAAQSIWAADPLQVAPEMYKLLFENERVRVMEVTFKPGEKIAEHSHPDHYAYVAEAGQLKITKPDGTVSNADLKAGQVMWIPAETHRAENTGTTQVRLVVNELKEKPMKMKTGSAPMQEKKKTY